MRESAFEVDQDGLEEGEEKSGEGGGEGEGP